MMATNNQHEINVAVLAGGIGKRFWPLSSAEEPKQFLPLLSDDPMIVETLKRLVGGFFKVRKAYILTNKRYLEWFKAQPFFHNPPFDIEFIFEPDCKNTAPPIIWVAHYITKTQKNPAPCLVLSADQWISPMECFQKQIRSLLEDIQKQSEPWIYTIGIPPTFPSTDYGYIECESNGNTICEVKHFIEKPDHATAKKYVSSGTYYWNAGIFFFKPHDMLEVAQTYAPDIANALPEHHNEKAMENYWTRCPDISIDFAIMEKTKHRKCLVANFSWSDIGTWEGLNQWQSNSGSLSPYYRNAFGNNKQNIVFSDHNHPIVLLGCKDLYVVNCKNKLLIAHKDALKELKTMVDEIVS